MASVLRNVAAAVGQNISPFELGVVAEVFGYDRSPDGLPAYDFAVVAVEPGPLKAQGGFTITTTHGLERLAEADLICIPAWDSGNPPPEEFLQALRAAVARGARVMSVCTGAFVLAAAGLLDGRRATTQWRHAARLAGLYPNVTVDPNVLYIDDGQVLTSAGTAAGIDLCLHILRQEHGTAVANASTCSRITRPS